MYENVNPNGVSKSKQEHKFFERHLNNNLASLEKFLLEMYKKIENGELLKGNTNDPSPWDESGSITTSKWNKYNAFQFHNAAVHDLFKAVKSMTQEACDHYGLNFEKERFMVQGWFNVNYNHIGKLDWHEHGGNGAPHFHGYYCVKAEPSTTYYKVFGRDVDNINKNNRAILSETGHPHAMGDWDWDGPRITMAYDVIPLRYVEPDWQQHWIPMV